MTYNLRICQVTSHQWPVTSHQSPVTSHQSPVTSHQSPVTSHQSPVTSLLGIVKLKKGYDGTYLAIFSFINRNRNDNDKKPERYINMEIKQSLGIEIISPNMEQALSSQIDQPNIISPHYRVRELPLHLSAPLSISPIRAFSPPLPSLMALALLFLRH